MNRYKIFNFGVVALAVIALLLTNVFIARASAPTIQLTLDPTGTVDRFGNVTLTGTVTCNIQPDFMMGGSGELRQFVGRTTLLQGTFFPGVQQCGMTTTPWSATVMATNGRFGGGQAQASVSITACVGDPMFGMECSTASVPLTPIKLKGGG
jgi:hypothetical protein